MAQKNHNRAAKFLKVIARKLSDEKCDIVISRLDTLLEQAVEDLPNGPIRGTLESDIPRYAELLRQILVEIRPELAKELGERHDESLDTLLKSSQCSVLADAGFARAVEALVKGAENGAGSTENLAEWLASCRRVLGSRSNPPLSLWWTYASLELHRFFPVSSGNEAEQALHVVYSANKLVECLKSLTSGRCHCFTAVSTLAPVVAALFEAGCILGSASDIHSGSWRKAVKTLNSACKNLLGCISVYRSRKVVECGAVAFTSSEFDAFSLDHRGLVVASKGISRVTGRENNRNGVAKLFPLASEALKHKLTLEIRDTEACANVVSGEAFLMRLMVTILEQRTKTKCRATLENPELCDELKFLAVQGLDMFVDFLMDSKLPVKPLLDTDEELLLKRILFDVLSQSSPNAKDRPDVFMKKLELARRAIEFYRSKGERSKAVDLSSRLSTWKAPSGFPEWLLSLKLEIQPPANMLKDSRALSGWLMDPANEKVIANVLSKLTTASSQDDTFYIDTSFDKTALGTMDHAFMHAAQEMKSRDSDELQPLSSDSEDEQDVDQGEEDAQEIKSRGNNELQPFSSDSEDEQDADQGDEAMMESHSVCDAVKVPAVAGPKTEEKKSNAEEMESDQPAASVPGNEPASDLNPTEEEDTVKADEDAEDMKAEQPATKGIDTAEGERIVEVVISGPASNVMDAKMDEAEDIKVDQPVADATMIDAGKDDAEDMTPATTENGDAEDTKVEQSAPETTTEKDDAEEMGVQPVASAPQLTAGVPEEVHIEPTKAAEGEDTLEPTKDEETVEAHTDNMNTSVGTFSESMKCPSTPLPTGEREDEDKTTERDEATTKVNGAGGKRMSKVLETPIANVPAPSSARCTRSGRKYNVLEAQVPASAPPKKRRYI